VNDLDDFRRAGDFAHAQAPFAATTGNAPKHRTNATNATNATNGAAR
jgi:phosphoenolpyruvate phosphomutase